MLDDRPSVSLILPEEWDTQHSAYRTAHWPKLPQMRVTPDWGEINEFRKKKFAHHVMLNDPDDIVEAAAWCEEQFGPQALGRFDDTEERFWTRGVWTWLFDYNEETVTLMFIERGFATFAKIRWG